MQGKARHDILSLNPEVFKNGPNNMKTGELLNLPDYAAKSPEKPKSSPAPATQLGDKWEVKPGDTLYSISRALFPDDSVMQAQVRGDIASLNPEIFQNGPKSMKVGALINLPDYVGKPASTPEPPPIPTAEPTPAIAPLPAPPPQPVVSPEKPPVENLQAAPQESTPPVTAEAAVENKVSPPPETTVETKETRQPPANKFNYLWALSIGYSGGGDKLVSIANGHKIDQHDIYAGSGAHIRLGFDAIPTFGSGYRIALGYRYDYTKATNGDASLSDPYIQTAYQYRANTMLYGAGIEMHTGPKLSFHPTSTTNTNFKSATGLLLYVEYIGDDLSDAVGVSYTSIDYKAGATSIPSSFNGSQGELYYSWKF